jgi:hypothetical protein
MQSDALIRCALGALPFALAMSRLKARAPRDRWIPASSPP